MAMWMLPRLKRFKELNIGYPPNLTPEEWDEKIDDMIFMFEVVIEEKVDIPEGKDFKRYKRGHKAFTEYWCDLWW
jgi:hypothetical protein